ncbi:MAG: glycosyltransferase [Pseudomonadales bacterium]
MSDDPAPKPHSILQICHGYSGPFRAIAGQYASAFAGHRVTTIFLKGSESREVEEEIAGQVLFLSLPSAELRGLKRRAIKKVAAALGDQKIDLIIAHRYKPFYIALRLKAAVRAPVLGVVHEFGFLRRWHRALYARCWPDSVHLVAVSEPLAQELVARAPQLSGRVHRVGNSMEPFACIPAAKAREELGLSPDKYCFGAIGRLVRRKNHRLLLESFSRLDDANTVLAIIGTGVLMEELQALARQLGIADRVVFCGQRNQARRYLLAFDAFVLPSRNEAFGLVLLEAVQAGVPVIAADTPGPKSVMGAAATWFHAGDAADLERAMREMQAMPPQAIAARVAQASAEVGARFAPEPIRQELRRLAQAIGLP